MATLRETLDHVQTRIERYKGLTINEQNTKASLIEPILRVLGWDTEDFEEVHREYKPKSADKPVDYALFLMRSPRVFIEAKALGQDLDDRRWANQIMGYASVAGVEWIILTDGDEYRIYNSHAAVPVEEKLFRRVRVGNDSERAEATLSLFAKESIQKDDIGMLWRAYFVDWRVRTAVEHLFAQDPDPALVHLIAERIRSLSESEIMASLGRAQIRLDFPVIPGVPSADASRSTAVSQEEQQIFHPSGKRWFGVSPLQIIEAGLIKAPLHLEHVRGDHRVLAQLETNGTITWQGVTYSSPSAAGGAALTSIIGRNAKGGKRAVDGWEFWCFRDDDGSLKEINILRQRYLAASKP